MDSRDLLADFIFVGKYAKYSKDLKRRETFPEAVTRMKDMHTKKYGHIEGMTDIIEDAFSYIYDGWLLASQRALQFAGPGIEKHNMRIFNCTTSYCDRTRFFAEMFYMLLCGCGTGFSVQKRHVNKLPPLAKKYGQGNTLTWAIPDTIEGWADALDLLIGTHLQTRDYLEICTLEFDYSLIRPKGAPLSTGGKAPGPEPLKIALDRVRKVLERAIDAGQERLRPIDCYDIAMHASDAVLSGGIRRAASIALFDADDEEMMSAKTGNWYKENPQRARANNSAVLIKSDDNRALFARLMKSTKEFGEPGFIFVSHPDHIFNPCAEISMCPQLITAPNGSIVENYTLDILENRSFYESEGYEYESGWQTCNLVTANAAKIKSEADFERVVRAAAVIGTLQAGYTNPGYLGETSRAIIEREALLGISLTGIMESPEIVLNPDVQRRVAKIAIEVNERIAAMIGINSAARVTCVKPEGTGTLVLKASNGIHADHAKRYIKRVQSNRMDPVYQWFRDHNPHMCEVSVWNTNTEDDLVAFPMQAKHGAIVKDDLTAYEFLSHVLSTQINWVMAGTARPMSCEGLYHNVSNTCEVREHEWSLVENMIYANKEFFSGISLLGNYGDYIYEQAPFQRVYSESDLIMRFGFDSVNYAKKLYTSGDTPTDCNEDTKFIISALKLEEYWHALRLDMVPVDYTELMEFEDSTAQADAIACGGGACTV